MYNTQPILPGVGHCLFFISILTLERVFEVNILHKVIGILQLATPKGTVGVSTGTSRKTSAISSNPTFQQQLRYIFADKNYEFVQ